MPAFRVVDEHLTAPVLVYSSSGGVFEQEKILTSGTGISINSVSGSIEISANLSVITQEVSQDLARKYLNEIVFNEIPAGIKDGINRTYTLVTAPSDESSIQFWINGQLQTKGDDYSLSLRNISILNNIFPTGPGMGSLIGGNSLYSAESNIVYLGNISAATGMGIVRQDRVAYNLFVPNDLTVNNIITSDEIDTSTITSSTITSDEYIFSNLNNLIKITPLSNFYSVLQLASSVYTYNDASWIDGTSSVLLLDMPGIVKLENSGSYIWIILDPYLINNGILNGISITGSSNASLDINVGIYDCNNTGTSEPINVDSISNNINSVSRQELNFNFSYTYLVEKFCYLKIEIASGTGALYIYRLALSINTNDSISTSLNII